MGTGLPRLRVDWSQGLSNGFGIFGFVLFGSLVFLGSFCLVVVRFHLFYPFPVHFTCCCFQLLGALCGFSTRGFGPRVSTALTKGWTGWKFFVAIASAACIFCTSYFGL